MRSLALKILLVVSLALLVTGCSQASPGENPAGARNATVEITHPDLGSLPNSRLFVGRGEDYAILLWWENLGDGRVQGEIRMAEKLAPEELDYQSQEPVFVSYTFYFAGFKDGSSLILDVRSRIPNAPVGQWTGELLWDQEAPDAPRLPALRLRAPEDREMMLFPADDEQEYAEAVAELTQAGTG